MPDLTQQIPARVWFLDDEKGSSVVASLSPGTGNELVMTLDPDSGDPLMVAMNRRQLQDALDATPHDA